MEFNIISGEQLGSYEAIGLSLGKAKKKNREDKIARYAVFTYQSTYSGRAKPVRDIIFEENLGDNFEKLKAYIKKDAEGNELKDSRGGLVVDIDAIWDAADNGSRAEKRIRDLYLKVPGGMVRQYKLQGARYANDINGEPILDRHNNRVVKETIPVFVQVERIIPGDDGKPVTIYVGGITPEMKGKELQDRFYREAVQSKAIEHPSDQIDDNDDSF